MKRLLAAILLFATVSSAVETLRPEQLRRGMKGYGLSVFKGTEPERFDVEILGVLENAFPKQDMILIRMSGANLEQHKVIAGMSGSPIYVEDKLIGALAYGWSFENEPLAGVTPIHNMLAEIQRPAPPPVAAERPRPAAAAENLKPLLTPLALAGFSPRTVAAFAEEFEKLGLLPVAAGSGGAAPGARQPGKLVAGGAVGVELIRGDFNAVGVGTVTHVDGQRVLAFGHPFFLGGQVRAPAVEAEVHTIMSSLMRSFKMASARGPTGAMIGDWQSCIVVDTQATAPMIPVSLTVANRTTGHQERYALEVIQNRALSPLFVQVALFEAVTSATGSSDDTMVRVELEAETATRPVKVANTFHNPLGGLVNAWAWRPLTALFQSPFGDPGVRRIAVNVDSIQARHTAEIKSAFFARAEAERGTAAPLQITVRPFGQPETTLTVPVPVPAALDSLRVLQVAVLAGAQAPADVAPPDNLNDYLAALEKQHRHTDLVVLVRRPGYGLRYRGQLLKNLPPSALALLDDSSTADITSASDVQQIVVPTHWVLTGRAAARIPIRQE